MWSFFEIFLFLLRWFSWILFSTVCVGGAMCVAHHLLFVTQKLGIEQNFSHLGVKWSNFSKSFK